VIGVWWFEKAMDSDDEEALAALMDEEVTVATTVRDAIGDKEQLPILVALLAMIADEDKTRIGGSAPRSRKRNPR
jgi:hypothetical protein